ncbi:protoplasts-secreted [Umbelopsis nana]
MKKAITCVALAALASFATALDCTADALIKTQSDLEGLRGCQVFSGKITVSGILVEELVIPGIQEIRGDLKFTDINSVTKISMPELKSVSGNLAFESVRDVHAISMPKLTAAGNFVLSVAPALTSVDFPAGLSQANAITISDTTATEVRGIGITKAASVVVDNNHYLKNINLSSITEVTNSIHIAANAPGFAVDLGKLQNLKSGDFRNIEAISLSSLSKVDGDLTFISNTFTGLELPKLGTVAKTITVAASSNLNKLAMPELTFVGGALSIADNQALTQIDSFGKLNEVDGTVDITGPYDDLQLPALTDVRGGMNLQTSSKQFSCDKINKSRSTVVKGNAYLCKSSVSNPTSSISQGVGKEGKNGESGLMSAGPHMNFYTLFDLGVVSSLIMMILV